MMPHTSPAAMSSEMSSTATTGAPSVDAGGKVLVTPVRRIRVMNAPRRNARVRPARTRCTRTAQASAAKWRLLRVGADVVLDVGERRHELVHRGLHEDGGAPRRLDDAIEAVLRVLIDLDELEVRR